MFGLVEHILFTYADDSTQLDVVQSHPTDVLWLPRLTKVRFGLVSGAVIGVCH